LVIDPQVLPGTTLWSLRSARHALQFLPPALALKPESILGALCCGCCCCGDAARKESSCCCGCRAGSAEKYGKRGSGAWDTTSADGGTAGNAGDNPATDASSGDGNGMVVLSRWRCSLSSMAAKGSGGGGGTPVARPATPPSTVGGDEGGRETGLNDALAPPCGGCW
jgi:hypothetical protein